jgi:hypothetical protein
MTDQHTAAARAAGPRPTRRMRLPRQPFKIIRGNLRAYLAMNAVV